MLNTLVLPIGYGATLVITCEGDFGASLFEVNAGRLEHLKPVLLQIGDLIREGFKKNFASGGRPAWMPLRPSTVAAKARMGMPKGPKGGVIRRLVQNGAFGSDTILIGAGPGGGKMRDAFVQKSSPDHVEMINEKDGTVDEGASVFYARFHQQGTKNMAARAQTLGEDDIAAMLQALTDYLKGAE